MSKEYFVEYYKTHREYYREKLECECGASVSRDNLIRHYKSKKHKLAVENVNLREYLDIVQAFNFATKISLEEKLQLAKKISDIKNLN